MTSAEWTTLEGAEPVGPDLIDLAERCLRSDGGMPRAAEPRFLRRRWAAPLGAAFAVREPPGGRLIAAGAVCPALGAPVPPDAAPVPPDAAPVPPDAAHPAADTAPDAVRSVGGAVMVTGLVDPEARGRGLGAQVLDHALALAQDKSVTLETESLTDAAAALFGSRGFSQTFAEDVMSIALPGDLPAAEWADGVELVGWAAGTAERFHRVYAASFRDRPGFPDDPADEWIADYAEDEGFRPEWSVMAVDRDGDVGFVTASDGWIEQVGVVPRARGRGLGAALVLESLGRMAAAGVEEAWLTVNVNIRERRPSIGGWGSRTAAGGHDSSGPTHRASRQPERSDVLSAPTC